MTIKNMHLRKGPAKLTWICCEGADGHSHEHNNWIQPALAGNLSRYFRFPRFPCQFLATGCSFLLGPLSLPLQDLLDGVLQALVDEVLGLLTLTLHIKQPECTVISFLWAWKGWGTGGRLLSLPLVIISWTGLKTGSLLVSLRILSTVIGNSSNCITLKTFTESTISSALSLV